MYAYIIEYILYIFVNFLPTEGREARADVHATRMDRSCPPRVDRKIGRGTDRRWTENIAPIHYAFLFFSVHLRSRHLFGAFDFSVHPLAGFFGPPMVVSCGSVFRSPHWRRFAAAALWVPPWGRFVRPIYGWDLPTPPLSAQ